MMAPAQVARLHLLFLQALLSEPWLVDADGALARAYRQGQTVTAQQAHSNKMQARMSGERQNFLAAC